MTPEEKKEELIKKFTTVEDAIICVDEILNSNPISPYPNGYYEKSFQMDAAREFWQQVKNELLK